MKGVDGERGMGQGVGQGRGEVGGQGGGVRWKEVRWATGRRG